jgi:NAD(P)-dependent dehydrogenase (short-subunit alcohol dehydrogenase family)
MKVRRGTRAVVTGAGSGIGKATALRIAGAGADVVCVDIDGQAADATATACLESAVDARSYVCDVADADAVIGLAGKVADECGPVDLLVNNAGVGVAGAFLDNSLDDWRWLRSINLDGVVHGCHAFGPAMVERGGGHVVNIASGAAYTPQSFMAAYCASKAAVVMFSQCLRADWGRHGVGVSAICPGLIKTPIPKNTRMVGAMAARRERAERIFRFGHSPDLVAKAIIRAAEKNQDVVPVGFESAIGYRVLRFAPGSVQALLAKASP